MCTMCPGWVLRRPKQFLEELLERLVKLMNGGNNQEMELVTQVSITLQSILYTLRSTLHTLHSTLTLYTLHSTLYTLHTAHCTLHTAQYTSTTLDSLRPLLFAPHCTLHSCTVFLSGSVDPHIFVNSIADPGTHKVHLPQTLILGNITGRNITVAFSLKLYPLQLFNGYILKQLSTDSLANRYKSQGRHF